MHHALVVGAVIDTLTPAAWVVDLIGRLERHALIDLVVTPIEHPPAPTNGPQTAHAVGTGLNPTANAQHIGPLAQLAQWIMTQRIDRPLFSQDPWQHTELKLSYPLSMNSGSFESLAQCDVILNLTSQTQPALMNGSLSAPVWSAHVESLNDRVKDALLSRAPLVWVYLWSERSSEASAEVLACHALPRQSYSLTDLQSAACFSLPALFESRLNWLANGIDVAANERRRPTDTDPRINTERQAAYQQAEQLIRNGYKVVKRNNLSELLRTGALLIRQTIERVRNRLFYEQWQLSVSIEPEELPFDIDQFISKPVEQYTAVKLPEKIIWADPHLYQHGNQRYVFFEEMAMDGRYAHLSVARLDESGRATEVRPVLDDGQHLSYPFVFGHQGEHYMIPETASRRSVSLYRAHDFPDQWERVNDLLSDVDLADTTLHCQDDTWWMFTNSQTHRTVDERDELQLFYADSLEGPWHAHPLSPIVTGVDHARMAGPLFRDDQHLYRVSQYGAKRYGHGVNIHRIDRIDRSGYQETAIGRILPDQNGPWLGCHSVARLGGLTVLDRVTRQRR